MALTSAAFVASALKLWRRHALEASLALLGVVAGVGGLVTVVAVGEGARIEIDRAVGALGAGTMIVRSVGDGAITFDRVAALDRLLGHDIEHRVPMAMHVVTVAGGGREVPDVKLLATGPRYLDAFALTLEEGRFIAAQDAERGARVCVLGAGLAHELFPRGGAFGSLVRLARDWHRVVGVMSAAAPGSAPVSVPAPDANRLAIVPLYSEAARVPLDEVLLKFADEADMVRASAAVQRIVEYGAASNRYEYLMPAELIRQKYRMQRVVGHLLTGITAVLLVVGGVSITNVMLMNVLRRRGEIGLRRAIGATQQAILRQFLLEAVLVCGLGGIVGVMLGLGATVAIASASGWPVAFLLPAAVGGLAASLLLGALSGSYPAWQAARVDPMRTLS